MRGIAALPIAGKLQHVGRGRDAVEEEQDAFPNVAFTNGITRTIRLLSNEAKAFPVETSSKEAVLLEQHAGSGLGTYTVEELLP